MFTYRRPNEISSTAGESFLAEGPTNEVLDVYVSSRDTHGSESLLLLVPKSLTFQTLCHILKGRSEELYFIIID